jgi:hypothetical protein
MALSDGDLRAMQAIRDLRTRCLTERWGAPALTTALAFALQVDYEAAAGAGSLELWVVARDRGVRLAHETAEQTFLGGVR